MTVPPAAPIFEHSADVGADERFDDPPPIPPSGPLSSERGRLVVTALVVGAIALFVGWSLGRAGNNGGSPTDELQTITTTLTTTIAPATVGATIAPVDPSLLPTTTAAAAFTPIVGTARPTGAPTTTTPAGWVTSVANVAAPAADLGVQIIGLRLDGTVIELDPSTGQMSSTDVGVHVNEQGGLYAGPDWILVTEPDNSNAALLRGHSAPEQVTLGQPWLLHWETGTDHFWRLDELVRFGDPVRAVEISYDGTPTGVQFDADGRFWIAGADPAGGLLVVGAPGGSYHVAPDGTSRITAGDVIALNATTVVATDCGEAMANCGLVVIDRATGATTPLQPYMADPTTGTRPLGYFDTATSYGFPSLLSAISPDGRYSPIMVTDVDPHAFGVIDLTTGEFTQFDGLPESSLWWSPDSRRAMYLVNGRLTVYDFDTRSTYEVSTDLFPLQEFVVRPQPQ